MKVCFLSINRLVFHTIWTTVLALKKSQFKKCLYFWSTYALWNLPKKFCFYSRTHTPVYFLSSVPLITVIFYHRFFNVKLVGEYGDTLTGGLKRQRQDNADPTARFGQISSGQALRYKWWLVFPKCEWMEKW